MLTELPSSSELLIEKSIEGRLNWEPEDPHALDVLFPEAQAVRDAIPMQLEALLRTIEATKQLLDHFTHEDPRVTLEAAEARAQQAASTRFHHRRHFEHLNAMLMILRNERMLGRMQAAQAALELANALLTEEETAWQELDHAARLAENQDPPQDFRSSDEDRKEEKVDKNIQDADAPLTPLIGSVEQSRRHLRAFEERLPTLRAHLKRRAGSFEIFYVRKKICLKPEVRLLLKAIKQSKKRQQAIPPELLAAVDPALVAFLLTQEKPRAQDIPKALEVVAYLFKPFGPYAKYRWRFKRSGRHYAIAYGPRDRAPGYVLKQFFS